MQLSAAVRDLKIPKAAVFFPAAHASSAFPSPCFQHKIKTFPAPDVFFLTQAAKASVYISLGLCQARDKGPGKTVRDAESSEQSRTA
jgi:hypothetical protein